MFGTGITLTQRNVTRKHRKVIDRNPAQGVH